MAALHENDNEPAKLTEEMTSEITEEEPIDNMVKPASPEDIQTEYENRVQDTSEPVVEPEDEERFQETTEMDADTTQTQESRSPNVKK